MFALRFCHIRTDDGEYVSQDALRAAFNSPFRPFVLATTSIGQEGLDFHPWCHRLIHWRIHRYKGHAVRRNVAAAHAEDSGRRRRPCDMTSFLAKLAGRRGATDARRERP